MRDHEHVVASGTNACPRPTDSTAGSTYHHGDAVIDLYVDHEVTVSLPARDLFGRSANHVVALHPTAIYGVRRDDGVWVTECAWCKRVRSVAGDWHALPPGARSAIRAERTHGICPDCADACLDAAETADRRA